jgi:hypothetical protein
MQLSIFKPYYLRFSISYTNSIVLKLKSKERASSALLN